MSTPISRSKVRSAVIVAGTTLALLLLVEFIAFVVAFAREGSGALDKATPVVNLATRKRQAHKYATLAADYFVFDTTLGVRFRPNARLVGLEPRADGTPMVATSVFLETDSLGFAANRTGEDRDYADLLRRDDVFRIITAGGSTTTGWGASSNEKTWPAVLEKLLNERPNRLRDAHSRVVVINAGVFGHAVSDEVKRFAEELYYYRPSLVVAFDGINEKRTYCGNPVDYTLSGRHRRMLDFFVCGRAPTLPTPSIFLPFAVDAARSILGLNVDTCPDSSPSRLFGFKNAPIRLDAVELYVSKLRQFESLAQSGNADFIHVFQPIMGVGEKQLTEREEQLKKFFGSVFYRGTWDSYIAQMRQFYDEVRPSLKAPWQYEWSHMFDDETRTVYSDPRHYNDLGQELIAEKLFVLLTESQDDT